jgi:hypothetical protein
MTTNVAGGVNVPASACPRIVSCECNNPGVRENAWPGVFKITGADPLPTPTAVITNLGSVTTGEVSRSVPRDLSSLTGPSGGPSQVPI